MLLIVLEYEDCRRPLRERADVVNAFCKDREKVKIRKN